jgi:hypothetical protein
MQILHAANVAFHAFSEVRSQPLRRSQSAYFCPLGMVASSRVLACCSSCSSVTPLASRRSAPIDKGSKQSRLADNGGGAANQQSYAGRENPTADSPSVEQDMPNNAPDGVLDASGNPTAVPRREEPSADDPNAIRGSTATATAVATATPKPTATAGSGSPSGGSSAGP